MALPELTILIFTFFYFTLFVLLMLVVVLIIWRNFFKKGEYSQNVDNSTEILEEAQKRSNTIIYRALKQARRMLVSAELTGLKTVSQEKYRANKAEEEYELQLKKFAETLEKEFSERSRRSESRYTEFIDGLEQKIVENINKNQLELEQKNEEFFNRSQSLLTSFVASVQHLAEARVEQEISTTRTIIENYKQQRMKIVDDNIVAILENTLVVVLSKTMSMSDHTDLIYDALEEAKRENFFA